MLFRSIYSSLTVQDILTKNNQQGLVVVGSDNFCTIIYKGNLFSLSADTILQLPNQPMPAITASLTAAQIATLSTEGTITVSYSQTVNFVPGLNNPQIDSMSLKAGSINLSLNSGFKLNGQIVINIPGAKKNGIAFSKVLPLVYSGTVPVIVNQPYDLSGYTFDMTNGGTTYNQFVVTYNVTLTNSGTPPLTTDAITLNQSLSKIGRAHV